mmetsp:Transcript_86338/g.277146  ORF Transcript_86338/g.277146 Transcript_86338/m.277146 type:complete len:535 (-) Transcript_86338:129-1733(-)
MSEEERESSLRKVVLQIPGDPPGRVLNLVEDPKGVISVGATGSVLWPASMALVRLLDAQVPSQVSSPRKLSGVELGAGLGAVGLFLAVYKGFRVVVSEVPDSVPLLQRNVEECLKDGAATGAQAAPLKWGDMSHMAPLGTFDVVVGSDITYRQDCLDDLLYSAEVLLAPGGRFLLSLQDRHGEANNLEVACQRRGCKILSKEAAEIHEDDVEFQDVAARDYCRGEDGIVKVWLYDLVPKTWKPASGTPAADGSLEDVEAEFERLTGIRPERLMPADFKRTDELQAVPSKAQIAAALKSPIKDTMVQDMLDRGLGDYLCDIDEDLSKMLAALDLDRRPRTAKQKQAFAAAFYAGEEPPSESIPARRMDGDRLTPEDEQVSAISSGGAAGRPTDLMTSERADAADAEAPRPSEDAPADTLVKPQHGTAKLCLPGLLWDVDVSDKDQRLTATVSFGEDAWWALQGSKARTEACTVAFKESVDFQLSDKELRVLHEGISVLELDLPLEVDATHAAAKLCSRRRRVVVRAPLRSSSAVS